MYKKILVALENSKIDQNLLTHVAELAKIHHSELILIHVADGWVARSFSDYDDQLELTESEEMVRDKQYLQSVAKKLQEQGLPVTTHLALGDPPKEILKLADEEKCDLIAMNSHGHRFWGHLLFGNTIDYVRHYSKIPVLVVR